MDNLMHVHDVSCTVDCSYFGPLFISYHVVLQVAVDNIDADLFGRGVRGGSFQPSDNTMHAIKTQAIGMLHEAYEHNLVRLLFMAHGRQCFTASKLVSSICQFRMVTVSGSSLHFTHNAMHSCAFLHLGLHEANSR